MKTAIIITSINPPNAVLRAIADGASRYGLELIVVGDTKSPNTFALPGCRFLNVQAQLATGFRLASASPVAHYARKNIGYLLAISEGAELIIETDDDNLPREEFFEARVRRQVAPAVAGAGWLNVYRYFSEAMIWPRGLPLQAIHSPIQPLEQYGVDECDCPIQQGLADENPDVDAIYRLILPLPQNFRADRRVVLGKGTWCPFNSQNTTWWSDAFPLLYLPSCCSFRMTDIWRSFVAQRIAWENGWQVLFHEPSVRQQRNQHDLMADFVEELPGYLHNDRIRRALEDLALSGNAGNMFGDLRCCYQALINIEVIGSGELATLDAWIADLSCMGDRYGS
jgi:hypothetical protein